MVMFLYRPKYYQIPTFENGEPTDGMAEIIIQKHRNGALADIRTKFIKEYALFTDSGLGGYTESTFVPTGNYTNPADNSNGGTVTFSSKLNDMVDENEKDEDLF